MDDAVMPFFLFVACSAAVAVGLLGLGNVFGPRKDTPVKQMPYESGMDPIHDTKRRFDFRFHLVAIAFLVFDVELLFLYPWAVATRAAKDASGISVGIDAAVAQGWASSRDVVFAGAMFFVALLVVGLVYDWRKGVFQWR